MEPGPGAGLRRSGNQQDLAAGLPALEELMSLAGLGERNLPMDMDIEPALEHPAEDGTGSGDGRSSSSRISAVPCV